MRTPVFAGNWKMHKNALEAVAWVREFAAATRALKANAEVVIAPPFTAIAAAAEASRGSRIAVAGQNLHFERQGAFTGEVSASMLKDAGAHFVIVGHSERRRLFGETDEWVQRKVTAAQMASLVPIVCVGETLEQRERGETLDVLDAQVRAGLDASTGDQVAAMILAYEPVWPSAPGATRRPPRPARPTPTCAGACASGSAGTMPTGAGSSTAVR
jgi:triosephosphate isomerase